MTSYRVVWCWYLIFRTEAFSDQAHCWAVHLKDRVSFSMGNCSVSLSHSSHTSLVIPHSTRSISYIFIYFIQTSFVVFRTKTTRLRKCLHYSPKGKPGQVFWSTLALSSVETTPRDWSCRSKANPWVNERWCSILRGEQVKSRVRNIFLSELSPGCLFKGGQTSDSSMRSEENKKTNWNGGRKRFCRAEKNRDIKKEI